MNGSKIMIAMSGGVDSSVAAALLIEKGFHVTGVTMQIWPDQPEERQRTEGGCCSLSAVEDARRVADRLGIPYYVLNFKDIFNRHVIDYFKAEYLAGRTPNPCIACNRFVKFDALLRRADAMGMDGIATGHYARIDRDPATGRYLLRKSATDKKDQTYALYSLTQEQLSKTLFPVGEYEKEQIREKAKALGLPVATKPDSQEICFVEDNDYGGYLERNVGERIRPGDFVDTKGNVLGRHRGLVHYTVGQRKGLGITFGKPMFVVGLDAENNRVILGEEPEVFSWSLLAGDLNFIPFDAPVFPLRVKAKIRYSAREADAEVFPEGQSRVRVVFGEPQRAVTPGQAVVFYDRDRVVGGGIIEKAIRSRD